MLFFRLCVYRHCIHFDLLWTSNVDFDFVYHFNHLIVSSEKVGNMSLYIHKSCSSSSLLPAFHRFLTFPSHLGDIKSQPFYELTHIVCNR